MSPVVSFEEGNLSVFKGFCAEGLFEQSEGLRTQTKTLKSFKVIVVSPFATV